MDANDIRELETRIQRLEDRFKLNGELTEQEEAELETLSGILSDVPLEGPEMNLPQLERLEELAKQSDVEEKLNAIHDEFSEKFAALEQKADRIQNERKKLEAEKLRKEKQSQDAARGLGVGMSIAWTILGLPLFGLVVGKGIEMATGNSAFIAPLMLIGVVAGVGMAVFITNRQPK